MEKLKINVPEGYEIDMEQSKIVFKKKEMKKGYYISGSSNIEEYCSHGTSNESNNINRNLLPTKEVAEQVLALMELLYERNKVWGDWKPDWTDGRWKSCIHKCGNKPIVEDWSGIPFPLAFKTFETAKAFLDKHRELITKAGDLI